MQRQDERGSSFESIGRQIGSVRVGTKYRPRSQQSGCLEEEEMPIRDMDNEVMGITKPGYAQTYDHLIKVNIGNEGEDRPTFVS